MMKAVLHNSLLSTMAETILADKESPEYLIARLGVITLNCIMTAPKDAVKSITHLDKMLPHITNVSVLSCFERIFMTHNSFDHVYSWLIKAGIVSTFVDIMKKVDYRKPFVKEEEYTDNDWIHLAAIYKLIYIASSNPKLVDAFACDEIFSCLMHIFHKAPEYIDGARWHAIYGLCGKKTAKKMEQFLPMCFATLYMPTERLSAIQVDCINFITNMLEFNPSISQMIIEGQILSVLSRLIIQFCNSSILHSSFRKFVVCALSRDLLWEKIIDSYVPVFMNECLRKDNGCLSATTWFLLVKIQWEAVQNPKVKAKLKMVSGYLQFCDKYLRGYNAVMRADYGGPVLRPEDLPARRPDDIDDM